MPLKASTTAIREGIERPALFRLDDEFDRERAYLGGLKENLATRKAWREKNAPAGN